MDSLCLLKDNRKLSGQEIERARETCREVLLAERDRRDYMHLHAIDEKFALPDANWALDEAHPFTRLFQRVARGATTDLNHLRGLAQPFSGYDLFGVAHPDHINPDLQVGSDFDEGLALRLAQRNLVHVQRHRPLIEGIPDRFVFRPPALLGEVGHTVDGGIVNHDVNAYQERINILHHCGILAMVERRLNAGQQVRICEIGGGYGALCHWFMKTFPALRYTVIDLPESLLFSKLYVNLTLPDTPTTLGLTRPNPGVRFVPNYMAEELQDSFDLVLNTLSMSEMTEHQVRKYAHLIKRAWLKEDGVFFEQNQDNLHLGFIRTDTILQTVFGYQYLLHSDREPHTQGQANLWANNPLD